MYRLPRELLTSFIFLGGSLCLFLCNISVPATDGIVLFELDGYSGTIGFGLWGICYPRYTEINPDGNILHPAGCTDARIGYTIGSIVAHAFRTDSMQSALTSPQTASLILFPIATFLTYVSLPASMGVILMHAWKNHKAGRRILNIVFSLAIGAMLVTLVAFFVQFGLCLAVKSRAGSMGDVEFSWGNIIWLTALTLGAHAHNCYRIYSMRTLPSAADLVDIDPDYQIKF